MLFGQAFGVGALEDDDEDIYSTDHISNYDITMGEEEDDNFGWTAPQGRGTFSRKHFAVVALKLQS